MSGITMNYEQFAEKYGIQFTWSARSSNPDWNGDGRESDHYLVTIATGGWPMSLPFSKGKGNNGAPPTLTEVLECLASDAVSVKNSGSFEEWASELCFDTDSRKAEKIYETTKRNTETLEATLGTEAFEQLLWHTSDDYFLSDEDDQDQNQEPAPGV